MKRICALCCNICLCVFCSQMLSVAANDCCHEVLFLALYVGFPSRLLLLVFPEGFSVFSSITSNKKDLPEGQICFQLGSTSDLKSLNNSCRKWLIFPGNYLNYSFSYFNSEFKEDSYDTHTTNSVFNSEAKMTSNRNEKPLYCPRQLRSELLAQGNCDTQKPSKRPLVQQLFQLPAGAARRAVLLDAGEVPLW